MEVPCELSLPNDALFSVVEDEYAATAVPGCKCDWNCAGRCLESESKAELLELPARFELQEIERQRHDQLSAKLAS